MPTFHIRSMLIVAGLALLPAMAQAQLGTTDSTQPLNIQADNGIEWQQDKQLYIARGNAVATRGAASMKADTLIAHYRKVKSGGGNSASANNKSANTGGASVGDTGSDSEIYRIEADGNVVITRDTRTVVGDHADYDVDQGIGVVHGQNLKMTTATDVVTAKDALEWYDQKQIAVARGDAVVVRPGGRTIKADVLTAYMVKTAPAAGAAPNGAAPPPKPAPGKPPAAGAAAATANAAPTNADESKITRVDAQGHVVVVNGADIGRGDYAVYNAVTDLCTLLGNVTIARGADVITGQYAVMDLKSNISRIMPASTLPGSTQQRVQGLFVKQDATGDKSGKK